MNSYLPPVIAMFGTFFVTAFLLAHRPSVAESPTQPNPILAPSPTPQPPPKPREYIPVTYDPPPQPVRPAERYYRDNTGKVMAESEIERNMQFLRTEIGRMPDNARRAYMQGGLRALEDEWARMRSRGPIN